MNGRIYDPLLGRMLSADLGVQFPGSLQSYNRYSYVQNNPLRYVDPTGFTLFEYVQGIGLGIIEANVPDAWNPTRSNGTESADATKGRAVGNVLAMIQGGNEVSGGGTIAGGGAVVTVGSVGVLSEVGVPAMAAGAAVATHGTVVTLNAVDHLKTNLQKLSDSAPKTGSDKGTVDPKKAPTTEGGEPHGNSKSSDKPQHRYEIVENESGDVVKTGISGQELNQNGTSPRANSQVNKLNKAEGEGTYSAKVKETDIPGRAAGLNAESNATGKLAEQGNTLRLQQRPKPQPKPVKPGEPPPPPDGS